MPTVSNLRDLALERIGGADEVIRRFVAGITAVNDEISAHVFYTRHRVKTVDSILNKIRIKRRVDGRADYSIDEISDIAGIRIVTLYDDQLPVIFESIIRTIILFSSEDSYKLSTTEEGLSISEGKTKRTAPLFQKPTYPNSIRKIKVYRRNHNAADFYNRIADREWPKGLSQSIQKQLSSALEKQTLRDDSYSSVHILTQAISYSNGSPKFIPLEIQIRTVAEDVWCEVSHSNKYKAKDLFFWSRNSSQNFDTISNTTSALKGHIDAINESIRSLRRQKQSIDQEIKNHYLNKVPTFSGSCLVDAAHSTLGQNSNDARLADLFTKISSSIQDKEHSVRINNKYYNTCISAVENTIEHIDFEINDILKMPFHLVDENMYLTYLSYLNSRVFLALEVIRLKTFLNENWLASGSARRTSETPPPFPWKDLMQEMESLEREHISYFKDGKFSERYDLVNPRSIINFIKYKISSRIEEMNSNDTFAYLSSAYELLFYDRTLFQNSIIRLNIKREYAAYIFSATRREVDTLKELNFSLNARVENLKHRFSQCFYISVDVYLSYKSLLNDKTIKDDISSIDHNLELFQVNSSTVLYFLHAIERIDEKLLLQNAKFGTKNINDCINYFLSNYEKYYGAGGDKTTLLKLRDYLNGRTKKKTVFKSKIDDILQLHPSEVK